jgi:hypothetical protein
MKGESEYFFVPTRKGKNTIEQKVSQVTLAGDLVSGATVICGKEDPTYYDRTKTLRINTLVDIENNIDLLNKVSDERVQKLIALYRDVVSKEPESQRMSVVRNILEMSRHIDPEHPYAELPPVTEEAVLEKYRLDLIKEEFQKYLKGNS